jgi:hypothetical protein
MERTYLKHAEVALFLSPCRQLLVLCDVLLPNFLILATMGTNDRETKYPQSRPFSSCIGRGQIKFLRERLMRLLASVDHICAGCFTIPSTLAHDYVLFMITNMSDNNNGAAVVNALPMNMYVP